MTTLAEALGIEVPDWYADGLCAQTDPDAFYPEKGGSTRAAKKVCLSCEVRAECLTYALDNDERFGIWGGLSERERRQVKADARSKPVLEAVPAPVIPTKVPPRAPPTRQETPPHD